MIIALLLILGAIPIFTNLIYKYNGKREILNIDFVQFLYGFVLSPIAFIFGKSFLFYMLKNELNFSLSINQIFVIDSIFSIFAFYFFCAVAIHSITKSFWLKRSQDPLYDIFHLSEYFHLWLTHLIMFGGGLILISIFSTVNLFFPIPLILDKKYLYATLLVGILLGISWFFGVWNSDPKQERKKFKQLMKLEFAAVFVYHVFLYFLFDPKFSFEYAGFWFVLAAVTALVLSAMLFRRSKKAQSFQKKLLHHDWGNNIQIFK